MVKRDLVVPVHEMDDTCALLRMMQIKTGGTKPPSPPDERVIYLEIESPDLTPGNHPLILVRNIGKNGPFKSLIMDVILLEGAQLLAFMKANNTPVYDADGVAKTFDDLMKEAGEAQ